MKIVIKILKPITHAFIRFNQSSQRGLVYLNKISITIR